MSELHADKFVLRCRNNGEKEMLSYEYCRLHNTRPVKVIGYKLGGLLEVAQKTKDLSFRSYAKTKVPGFSDGFVPSTIVWSKPASINLTIFPLQEVTSFAGVGRGDGKWLCGMENDQVNSGPATKINDGGLLERDPAAKINDDGLVVMGEFARRSRIYKRIEWRHMEPKKPMCDVIVSETPATSILGKGGSDDHDGYSLTSKTEIAEKDRPSPQTTDLVLYERDKRKIQLETVLGYIVKPIISSCPLQSVYPTFCYFNPSGENRFSALAHVGDDLDLENDLQWPCAQAHVAQIVENKYSHVYNNGLHMKGKDRIREAMGLR
ncbi:hypothetical protein TorRG33x02_250260 [Trema orientale]|uniref:Uncharacterized protein n=1 Tax=Trema orientale TaxID=63057 RepID=A0A2P5DJ46_TREOI|nr:hypothetical protein TorRG33x02_250260 [Trema orientale]